MSDLSLEAALATRLDPQIMAFEENAHLWRLEVDRLVTKLRESQAFGETDDSVLAKSRTTIEGIQLEIQRFQRFTSENSQPGLDLLVRLAEVAVALQTALRRLQGVLSSQ